MNWDSYTSLFDHVINKTEDAPVYENENYIQYTKLNQSRQNRWLKNLQINQSLEETVKALPAQKWILITEPWCGDSAHSAPVFNLLTKLNPKIELEVQLRDTNSEIDNYLTNGGKSIPILIARDKDNKDLFRWGPRPSVLQDLVVKSKNDTSKTTEEKKKEIQVWYNKDKGQQIQNEIFTLLRN